MEHSKLEPKQCWSIILFGITPMVYFFPQWNGFLFGPSVGITTGDGRIISSILFVGGLILWYLPNRSRE